MYDNDRILVCPACNKRMSKEFISSAGIKIDICVNCGGIFFDNNEMKFILGSDDVINEINNFTRGKQLEPVDDSKRRDCPFCSTTMVKNYSNTSMDVQVDECYKCGGKFLDHGELARIYMQNPKGGSKNVALEIYKMLGEELREKRQKAKEKSVTQKLKGMISRLIH